MQNFSYSIIQFSYSMQHTIEDPEFGRIILKKNKRSTRYTIRIKEGMVCISLPVSGSYDFALDFLNEKRLVVRQRLSQQHTADKSTVEETMALWAQAHRYLPGRLRELAILHHFHYTTVKINRSQTRWGSCSSRKSINLSYRLMTLPAYLIDYVLLHELCHTVHMNHGVEFWKLMNQVCAGKALQLRRELSSPAKTCA